MWWWGDLWDVCFLQSRYIWVNMTRFSMTVREELHNRVDKEGYYMETCLAVAGYHMLNTILEKVVWIQIRNCVVNLISSVNSVGYKHNINCKFIISLYILFIGCISEQSNLPVNLGHIPGPLKFSDVLCL
jgi:hypothetical protein